MPKRIIKLKNDWSFIDESLNKIKVSRFSACINYVLNFKIDKILIGINDLKQLDEILKFKRISKKVPFFSIKKKNLIDPVYWLKFKKNETTFPVKPWLGKKTDIQGITKEDIYLTLKK